MRPAKEKCHPQPICGEYFHEDGRMHTIVKSLQSETSDTNGKKLLIEPIF
ncbi:hypothetical protein ASZ90_019686 [hydrocarbon metagenome]|uniref:Uncharacterized protein n=1 Tax=hydrocarbon metagenome TaxID=938273 RepID=A0A0W8E2S7_9ZZZZ